MVDELINIPISLSEPCLHPTHPSPTPPPPAPRLTLNFGLPIYFLLFQMPTSFRFIFEIRLCHFRLRNLIYVLEQLERGKQDDGSLHYVIHHCCHWFRPIQIQIPTFHIRYVQKQQCVLPIHFASFCLFMRQDGKPYFVPIMILTGTYLPFVNLIFSTLSFSFS